MASYLKDFGISTEIFYDALAQGRNARDINKAVFEKLLAMEDFVTFKKIMVKRNVELQLEAIKCYRTAKQSLGDDVSEADFLKSLYYRGQAGQVTPHADPEDMELERRLLLAEDEGRSDMLPSVEDLEKMYSDDMVPANATEDEVSWST